MDAHDHEEASPTTTDLNPTDPGNFSVGTASSSTQLQEIFNNPRARLEELAKMFPPGSKFLERKDG